MNGSRSRGRRLVVEEQRLHVHDHQHAIDVGIEVADVPILLDRLARGLGGMEERLVVQQLLERVVGVELGEEERRISQTRSGDGERACPGGTGPSPTSASSCGVVRRDGQPLRRDVTLEDERCPRRRRVVQLVVALERPAARQIAQADAELVLMAILELAVVGQHRLVEVALLRRFRRDVGVAVRAGLGERAGGIELRGAAVGEDERGAVPLR